MKPKGWRGESRRHSLARKGVSTNIDGDRRFDVSNFVARGSFKDVNWNDPDWNKIKGDLLEIENSIKWPNKDTKLDDLSKERNRILEHIEEEFRKRGIDEDEWWIEGIVEESGIYSWVSSVFDDMLSNYIGKQIMYETPSLYEWLEQGLY